MLAAAIGSIYLTLFLAPDLPIAYEDCTAYAEAINTGAVVVLLGAVILSSATLYFFKRRPFKASALTFVVLYFFFSWLLVRGMYLDDASGSSPAKYNQICPAHKTLKQWYLPPL
jgi:hypothetical protein